ncbi:MAG: response regulator [Candidatus Omnitrophota bacterium]|nr:response regulator [Candidatus Omnitrophota bacterium]MDZ4242218.1 response regulator [Candidatus Omnitrophota bacterium]
MKKRILIIDDEDAIRENYARLFRSGGNRLFDVLEAPDAVKATNLLIRERVDLILLDLRMPGIGGQRIFEVIREYDPHLKVMVASVFPEERQRQLVPDATEYYDKSQGPVKLMEKVIEILFM